MYDDAKVRVGSFFLGSFGRRCDDGRFGWVLVGGGALLCKQEGRRGEERRVRHKTTRANRSPERSVPQGAQGPAPDVGSGILSFLLLSGNVEVLSGRVSSFCSTTTTRPLLGRGRCRVCFQGWIHPKHTTSATLITSRIKGLNSQGCCFNRC